MLAWAPFEGVLAGFGLLSKRPLGDMGPYNGYLTWRSNYLFEVCLRYLSRYLYPQYALHEAKSTKVFETLSGLTIRVVSKECQLNPIPPGVLDKLLLSCGSSLISKRSGALELA